MIYSRKLLPILQKQINSKQIIVLTGMRRVGKTTLYQNIFKQISSPNKFFLDIENPLDQKIFEEEDFNNIIFNLKKLGLDPKSKIYLFLDEIQAMPKIIMAIKYLYDHYQIKFFLTGSSSYYLKNLFPESLSGRKFIFELYPLDFEEFLIFKEYKKEFYVDFLKKDKNKNLISYEKTKKYYDEYEKFGGFPEVVLEKDFSQKKLILNDIFKSYFEKDVKSLSDFKQLNILRDLILLLMERVGSKIDISKLASELSVSRDTIYSYLHFLENTYFIHLISPFSHNVDREVSGTKKVYFCDQGLLNQLAKISSGALFENSIFNNLLKYGQINYYQKRSGAEIDFIIDKKIALEVKSKGTESDYHKLKKIASLIKIKHFFIITKEFFNQNGFIPAIEV
ncbi:MAG: ATP-binding protein [Candidatus Roizmanbacteria bacterium]|nr:ATP-binding protein [Candidatus Roizmanbacteria bacterium]MCR4312836.1 ATP-binding protein [Candidatus Roizmanbacteria bacterium]